MKLSVDTKWPCVLSNQNSQSFSDPGGAQIVATRAVLGDSMPRVQMAKPLGFAKVCTAEPPAVEITATCRVRGQTGVEMEALCAVSAAALTVYDMCKAVDRGMTLTDIRLRHKAGGRSGSFTAD